MTPIATGQRQQVLAEAELPGEQDQSEQARLQGTPGLLCEVAVVGPPPIRSVRRRSPAPELRARVLARRRHVMGPGSSTEAPVAMVLPLGPPCR